MSQTAFTFAQQQRLRFVEVLLLWEGSVQRQRVCDQFRVVPNHVTKDLRTYQLQNPQSLEFKPSIRAYVPGPKFKPVFASPDPDEYLNFLLAHSASGASGNLPAFGGEDMPVSIVPTPTRSIERHVLQAVLQAIRRKKGLEVQYSSMSTEEAAKRKLWPHSLVFSGISWHVRAYDGSKKDFRNFSLQRISQPVLIDVDPPKSSSADGDWNTLETLEITPNPSLRAFQKRIVAKEFGMKSDGNQAAWKVKIRRCLIGYFVSLYRLDDDKSSNRLHLKNRDRLKPFIFGAEA